MSIATLRKPSVGRHIVPCWFKDILHSIIYSDCIQAYLAIIAFLRGFTCTELGVLSALLRGLTECEAIEHACICKSRYHIVKRNLCEKIHLGEKCMGKKAPKKSAWSFRETDCFSNVLNEGDV